METTKQTTKRNEPLNCLRCRHCALLPWTDFSTALDKDRQLDPDVIIPIHCKKRDRNRPAHILTECPIADPRPRFVRNKSGNLVPSGGDKCFRPTDAENAFLEVFWKTADWKTLIRASGRDRLTLLSMGHRRGWRRDAQTVCRARCEAAIKPKRGLQRCKIALTDEQSAYILARHLAGHRNEPFEDKPPEWVWPRSTWPHPAALARNRAIKADILAEVAKRGPARTWETIRRHPEWKSKRYQRQHKERAIRRAKRREKAEGI